MNYPPPFGQAPPVQGQPQYPRPGMQPGQFGFLQPASGNVRFPPFQQAPPPTVMAAGGPRSFQSPPMYTRPPVVSGAPSVYQAQQQVYHAPPVLRQPVPNTVSAASSANAEPVIPTTVYVGNITDRYPDFSIAEILSACGPMLSWKRVKGADSKLQAFGFCEFERPDAALRAIRILNDLLVGNERKLIVTVDQKTKERLVDWQKTKLEKSGKLVGDLDIANISEYLDDKTLNEDTNAKEKINQIIIDANAAADKADQNKPSMLAELPKKTMHGLEIADDRRHIITKEIRHFRDEKGKKGNESPNSESSQHAGRSPSRQREETPSATAAPTDATTGATTAASAVTGTVLPGGGVAGETVVDEEEAAERRRAERRAREKAERYSDRLKAWESREREKARYYKKHRDREAENQRKQDSDARKMKIFHEDYDDKRDDPRYYRGSALSQRLKDREREIESDSRDRRREREEMDDVRRKLRDQGCNNLEEEMEKLERANNEHLLPRLLRGDENSPTSNANNGAQTKASSSPHSDSNNTPSLEQHIQLLSSKLAHGGEEAADNDETAGDKAAMDASGRQFVPARFEAVGEGAQASSTLKSPQQVSSRKRSSETTDEAASGDGVSDATTVALKMSLNKAKRLQAALSLAAPVEADPSTGMGRLGLMVLDPDGENTSASSSTTAMSEENKKERIQQLIKSIPTERNDLFAYAMDWGVVDKSLMEKRVRPWIDKKIVEYIGEKEPTLSEFLCQKVLTRTAPEKILEDISVIFDEDAELFVVKLWRLLIYETEAKKQKLTN